MMVIEVLFIGLVLGFLFYELTDVSPGGVVAPGYIALFVHQPAKIGVTIGIALVVYALIRFLSRYVFLYGRRKLLVALLLGFCLKLVLELWIRPSLPLQIDLESIGYIIPGLIANEMVRQKIIPTLSALTIVTVVVYLLTLLLVV